MTIYRESTTERMKSRNKSAIYNIRKQKTTNQSLKKKNEFKKMREPLEQLQVNQHLRHRVDKRRIERAKNENLLENIMTENFPTLVKEIDIQLQEV